MMIVMKGEMDANDFWHLPIQQVFFYYRYSLSLDEYYKLLNKLEDIK